MKVRRRWRSLRGPPVPALVGLTLLAVPALTAAGSVTCHCFRARSFEPLQPNAADPYLLATAQNSLLAAAFGLEKSAVVRAKMTGTAGPDLWVAQFAASGTGVPAAELLTAHARTGRWAAAFSALGFTPAQLPEPLAGALRGADDAAVASGVVDAVVQTRLGVDPAPARALGAGDRETIAACLLAAVSGHAAGPLYQTAAAGEQSWGQLFYEAGVAPEQVEAAVRRQLR